MNKEKKKKKTMKTMKKKTMKKTIIMRGGQDETIPWDYGGTGIEDLPADIIGVIVHTINTILNAINVMEQVIGLPANMGTAFSSPTEPTPDQVDVTGM